MAETKGKIIKKSVNVPNESEYAVDARSSLIEGEVYEASQVAKDIVQKAQHQSEAMLSKAREESSEILRQANVERERLIDESRDSGYQEGLAKATELITKSKEYYQRTVESSKDNLKMLAVKIAEKIVGRALELDAETINDIVSQAIRTLRRQKNVIVRCNQEDYDALKKHENDFLGMMGQSGVIDFVADPKITRGGCIVESELGIVDARLETQLKTLQKLLLTK
jgi:type III secretion protein L